MTIGAKLAAGDQVGFWLVVEPTSVDSRGNKRWWCKCQCGVERAVYDTDLRRDKSIGCKACAIAERIARRKVMKAEAASAPIVVDRPSVPGVRQPPQQVVPVQVAQPKHSIWSPRAAPGRVIELPGSLAIGPARSCQWIEGHGRPWAKCGELSVAHSSYCACHRARVFVTRPNHGHSQQAAE